MAKSTYISVRSRGWQIGCGVSDRPRAGPLMLKTPRGRPGRGDGERGVPRIRLINQNNGSRNLGAGHDMVNVGSSRRSGHWASRIGPLLLGYSAQATALPALDEARPEPPTPIIGFGEPEPQRFRQSVVMDGDHHLVGHDGVRRAPTVRLCGRRRSVATHPA